MPRQLIIDTNIISHALTPHQTEAYAKLFAKLEQAYTFTVSGVTKYELLKGSNKEHQRRIIEHIAADYVYIELSDALMSFSARLHNLYSKHLSTRGHKITDGDIINAALSIIKNAPIITMDNNDYPMPFFREIQRERVTYDSGKNKEVTDTIYIIEPDLENLHYCFKKENV